MDLIAKAVTLKSIKLTDPSAKTLPFSSKHSVLYSFSTNTSTWEKTETEGCLAIYSKTDKSSVLFILNRLRPENFSCPLTEIENVQLEGDLLMILLKNSKVMGIWLFDEKERQSALTVLEQLLQVENGADNTDENVHLKKISVTDLLGKPEKLEKSQNILDLLSKAKIKHDEIVENEHFPVKTASVAPINNHLTALSSAIFDHFNNQPIPSSLKSFTSVICNFLTDNPQLLAPLHRQLTTESQRQKEDDD